MCLILSHICGISICRWEAIRSSIISDFAICNPVLFNTAPIRLLSWASFVWSLPSVGLYKLCHLFNSQYFQEIVWDLDEWKNEWLQLTEKCVNKKNTSTVSIRATAAKRNDQRQSGLFAKMSTFMPKILCIERGRFVRRKRARTIAGFYGWHTDMNIGGRKRNLWRVSSSNQTDKVAKAWVLQLSN